MHINNESSQDGFQLVVPYCIQYHHFFLNCPDLLHVPAKIVMHTVSLHYLKIITCIQRLKNAFSTHLWRTIQQARDKDLALFLVQYHFDFPVVEESQPAGASWLFHSKTLESYLFLLGSSQREETREACCGILQSLTAQEGLVRRNI